MKIFYKLFIIVCIILIFHSIKISIRGDDNNKKNNNNKKEIKLNFEDKIKELFNIDDTEEGECKQVDIFLNKNTDDKYEDGGKGNLPQPKENHWKNYAKGDAAYLFDHLDEVLQKIISTNFETLYKGALENQEKKKSSQDDLYSYKNLIHGFFQGKYDGATEENKNRLNEIFQDFSRDKWDHFITLLTIKEIINEWRWESSMTLKKVFDEYDFNGDGRLDRKEFILFSIIYNKSNFGKKTSDLKYSYENVISDFIDPMFMFFDCDKNKEVTAEEMWKGLKKLKRKNNNAYSLFSCKLMLDMEKEYRTISVNDFILLNSKNKNGVVDIEEFRTGILLGFWNRQVKSDKIVNNDEFTNKGERWTTDGKDDKFCLSIKFFMKESTKLRKKVKEEMNKK
jgi:Ca2+-binding EF-hand superfamily protein